MYRNDSFMVRADSSRECGSLLFDADRDLIADLIQPNPEYLLKSATMQQAMLLNVAPERGAYRLLSLVYAGQLC